MTSNAIEMPRLLRAIDDASEALGDARRKPSNRTRAARILDGLSDEYAAHVAGLALSRVATVVRTQGGVQNRMAYFFRVLEDITGQARAAWSGTDSLAGRYSHLVRR